MSKKYDEILEGLEKKEEQLRRKLDTSDSIDRNKEIEECRTLLKQFMQFEKPTNELMFQLIDKIEVDKDKNVEVYFKSDISKYIDVVRKKGEIAV